MVHIIGTFPIYSLMKMRTSNKSSSPIFFLTMALVFLAYAYIKIGPLIASKDVFMGVLFNELLLILFPALLLRRLFKLKESPKKIEGEKLKYVTYAIFCAFPLILLTNGVFLKFLSQYIELENDGLEVLRSGRGIVEQVLFLALIPSVAEEYLFRGVVEKLLLRHWRYLGLILSALIFALFHFEIQNLLAPFLFGLLLSYIYLKMDHLAYVIYGHFLHNLISILFIELYSEASIGKLANLSLVKLFGDVQTFLMVFLLGISFLAFLGLKKSIQKIENIQTREIKRRQMPIGALFPLIFLLGVYMYALN